ncbi:IDEAL domain-containing protein [Virgibacillus halophilus]|uniref:IDEAL domain-containing protein n=1 Tax=Tigheibacillus halophilus TaxID=361280 RepID=A0ABU5C325_9BACI|nr:IDEAL domain-containing protein [Virgibacillus halophilus]
MVTVKMLKPYYIKADDRHIRIVLAYQSFAVVINNKVYQFIPVESKQIRINRVSGKVENIDAKFAFQKGKNVIYMSMAELISTPGFLMHLHTIAQPYLKEAPNVEENEELIQELEMKNLRYLIDRALDERNEEKFDQLTKILHKEIDQRNRKK